MNKKSLSFTVGITTCYGEESILDTVNSIRGSKGVGKFRLIIIADRNPIKADLKKQLKKYGVELHENKRESGQIRKKKQILDMCKTDVIIFTQDDVIFQLDTIAKIMHGFEEKPEVTFIGVRNEPAKESSFIESVISVGTRTAERISQYWNNGDNYLAVIGRCEAFRTGFVKKHFRFMDNVVSTDAFFYFENKKHGGKYLFIKNAKLFFKNPSRIDEHLRKSSRYQHSNLEMSKYFKKEELDYTIPALPILKAGVEEFLTNPVKFILYICLYVFTRISKIDASTSLKSIWEVDFSTKKILTK